MTSRKKPSNLVTLDTILSAAEKGSYAVGSFSPRYVPLIRPILRVAQKLASPVIVQISQRELERYGVSANEFADMFYVCLEEESVTVPVVLHLDHTKDFRIIQSAVENDFTSVMIDASELPLKENIAATRRVVDYAKPYGVSVEAELGKIGSTDNVETDQDEMLYTDPDEAERFVVETQVDALAVSVGTAHGVYSVREPRIDYDRLMQIRARTTVPLVLHGGSGVPAEMMRKAVTLPEGGISKVNIATDLELAFLSAIGRRERLTNCECLGLPQRLLEYGLSAVEKTVQSKIVEFLGSDGKASKKELKKADGSDDDSACAM